MRRLAATLGILMAAACGAAGADASTYEVGPGKPYAALEDVDDLLGPGDLVLVSGGQTYPGGVWLQQDGSPAQPITIRGVGSPRPVLNGGTNTIELAGDNTVLEGFDLTGGSFRCLYLHGDGLVVRDTVVHHCPAHGILGADNDSGDATLERVEVHHAGNGTGEHSIYMATDEIAHPGSVFRMRNCWVHDSTGGNLVKSRAERNEIYYNRLEGNDLSYHELELIGPDPGGGSVPAGVREDSDVVGNLLVHRRSDFRSAARVGGDATGESEGRYRFVANTFLGVSSAPSFTVFRAFDRLESIEAVGNVMHRPGGVQVMRDLEADWVSGARSLSGASNWITSGSDLSTGLGATLQGADPGLDGAWRPAAGSPLVDVGYAAPLIPGFEPPLAAFAGAGASRPIDEALDIGAYELPDPSYRPPGSGGPGSDSARLRLRGLKLRRTRKGLFLVASVSQRAKVAGHIDRPRGKRWRLVKRLRKRAVGPGTVRLKLARLPRGRYRIELVARADGQRRSARLRFRIGAPKPR